MIALRFNFIGSLIFMLGLVAVTLSQESSRRQYCSTELHDIMARVCHGPNPPMVPRSSRSLGVVSDMLASRRYKRGIADECCHGFGCTFDELRDYCVDDDMEC